MEHAFHTPAALFITKNCGNVRKTRKSFLRGHRLLVGAYLVYAQVVFEDNKDDVVLFSRFRVTIIPIFNNRYIIRGRKEGEKLKFWRKGKFLTVFDTFFGILFLPLTNVTNEFLLTHTTHNEKIISPFAGLSADGRTGTKHLREPDRRRADRRFCR